MALTCPRSCGVTSRNFNGLSLVVPSLVVPPSDLAFAPFKVTVLGTGKD
jgi:hypothetical protein